MTAFEWIRANVSLCGFLRAQFPTLGLTPGAEPGKFACACPLHQEKNGESFLIDESTGKWTCRGKCGCSGDLTQLAAYLWGCGNRQAAERLRLNAGDYPKLGHSQRQARDGEEKTPLGHGGSTCGPFRMQK